MNFNPEPKTFDCRIEEHYLILSEHGSVTKEFNLVSFGGNKPKYDIRLWQTKEGEKRPLKGTTLTAEEMARLKQFLLSGNLDLPEPGPEAEKEQRRTPSRKPKPPHPDTPDRIDHGFNAETILTEEDLISILN